MVFHVIHSLMALLFAVSAALQLNDPDPVQWFAIYGAAAVISAFAALRPGRLPRAIPIVVGLVALVWAIAISPGAIGKIGWGQLAETMHAETPAIEIGRETIGLMSIAIWMTVTAFAPRRASA
jgi:hypothetical protein